MREQLAEIAESWSQLTCIPLPHQGKGRAVREGMLAARGELLLFADADGATPIEESDRLRTAIEQGADIAVGSRLLSGSGIERQRSWSRGVMGRTFSVVTNVVLRLPVQDTQCGFKMFRREVGKRLFGMSRENGFLFDLELLLLAESQGYRIAEVPVNWSEQPGGHFHWRESHGTLSPD